MNLSLSRSAYFCGQLKTDTAESLYGVDIDDFPVTLGYIYKKENGKWHAEYFSPSVVREFDSRDQAANFLYILATQDADHLQFIG